LDLFVNISTCYTFMMNENMFMNEK